MKQKVTYTDGWFEIYNDLGEVVATTGAADLLMKLFVELFPTRTMVLEFVTPWKDEPR